MVSKARPTNWGGIEGSSDEEIGSASPPPGAIPRGPGVSHQQPENSDSVFTGTFPQSRSFASGIDLDEEVAMALQGDLGEEDRIDSSDHSMATASKHIPKRGMEFRAYGPIDRTPAQVGKEDLTKINIDYPTRRPDPDNPGEYIDGTYVKNRYKRGVVDWTSRASITKLNAWREQIFRRTFGETRKVREFWTESERDDILRLAARQLRNRRSLAFNRLANNYNKEHYLAGAKNLAGERRIALGREKKGTFLDEDRTIPWRSVSAIKNQAKKWESFIKLMDDTAKKGKKKDEEGKIIEDSGDEMEIFDPHPEPPSFEKTVQKRKALVQKGKNKKQAKLAAGKAVTPLDEDSGSELSDLPGLLDIPQHSTPPAYISSEHIVMLTSREGPFVGGNDVQVEEGAKENNENDEDSDDLYNA